METSILQINTGGEALLCLFCCKHESTFMLVECSDECVSEGMCALSCMNVYRPLCLFILTLACVSTIAQP